MKLTKQRLMELASLTEDPKADNAKLNYNNNINTNQYKKHKGYIAVYRVLGQDFTVGPLKTNDRQEVLDMLGGAIQGGFRLMDIVPTDQFQGVEKYGGLMLERATALSESFEEEAENLISRQAGTIMTMRQDSDKAAFNLLDQALEKLVADQVDAGYSNDAIHGFFTSLVRDAIESLEGEKETENEE